ncbi:RHS repeat domain-containing protein [Paenibacillus sp. FSL H7-0357]|uniref:RHS repeat domain-containing protein n=1 Tax=Paenibacillus sp. FSL H7-0357 TaxID=1536774 RepID=UPI000A7C49DF|nr:RHS repeat-associated core domain-containing protein [Paenibacillus sp. FSL H7-0357]
MYGADKVLNPDALLKVAQAAGPQVLESNRWDASNRLIGNTNAYGDITTYKYDGDGNRVSMRTTIGDGAIQDAYLSSNPAGNRDGWEPQYKKRQIDIYFTNDITMSIPQPLMATGADGQNWKQSYVYGAGEERISMSYLVSEDESNDWEPAGGASGAGAAAVAPKTLYYLSDAQGSVIGLEGQDGSISARYRYDEFGVAENPEKFDLNWSGPDNLFGYTSLGYDYYSGYSHAQARDFDSSIGRFISEDTYEGQIDNPLSQNLYTYVENNPLRYVDPSGNIAMAAGGLYLIPGVGEVLAVVTGAGIVVYGGYKIYQWATAPEEAPNVSIPKKIELKVIPGGNNTNKPDPNPKPKAPPVNQPNNDKQRKEPTKIYRLGSDSPWNLTPRATDATTGLSFQLTRPTSGGFIETTVEQINATGILVAIIDGQNHVSVVPTDGNLKYWASQRPNTGDPAKDSYNYNTQGSWNRYTTTLLNIFGSYNKWVQKKGGR